MRRELLILRHAKSSWNAPVEGDFNRPLASRGIRDATRVGDWLESKNLLPELTLCSAALRARQTAELALAAAPGSDCEFRETLYHAGLATLVNSIRETAKTLYRLMLVGHNPGLDQLLVYLCEDEIEFSSSGKLMTTAALAHIEVDCPWAQLEPEHCKLIKLRRPR